jgi:hypothetical protein
MSTNKVSKTSWQTFKDRRSGSRSNFRKIGSELDPFINMDLDLDLDASTILVDMDRIFGL